MNKELLIEKIEALKFEFIIGDDDEQTLMFNRGLTEAIGIINESLVGYSIVPDEVIHCPDCGVIVEVDKGE